MGRNSPALHPLETSWAIVKARLHKTDFRTKIKLIEGITQIRI